MEQPALRPRCLDRARIGFALVLTSLLLSQLDVIVNLVQRLSSAMPTESMSFYESRFAEARKILPRSGVIGYLSDTPDTAGMTPGLYERRYSSAQYCLAPLVIANSTEPELILGNFFFPGGAQRAMAGRKFLVLHDFRNGVLILRKEGP